MEDDIEAAVASTSSVDFRLVCRTCLAADAEFYRLDAPILCEDDEDKVSMLECLRYCTRLENKPQFPIYICTECSAALQVAYKFIRNAIDAHEILRQKLCPLQRSNGLHKLNEVVSGLTETGVSGDNDREVERVMRYRCKICNEKVETRTLLKEHVKLHSDIIFYCCQLCDFESKKRSHLNDHYTITHGIQATRDHLRLKTFATAKGKATDEINAGILLEQTQMNTFSLPVGKLEDGIVLPVHLVQQPQIQVQQCENAGDILLQPQQIGISTMLSSTDTNHINAISNELQEFGNDFNIGNEVSVGNEFIVMSDGTVEEVMDNGVVIEYINATDAGNVALDGGLVLDNIVQVQGPNEDIVNMDVDDIIIEENVGPELNAVATNIEDEIPQAIITVPNTKHIKCKICAENFISQDSLKTHMLTHNEIPHFFCDQCKFYTFFKIDLTQHYKTKHNLQPTHKQLQPKNKVTEGSSKDIFSCDLCLFETSLKSNLRRHYLSKHKTEASEVQLRPAIAGNDGALVIPGKAIHNVRTVKPDYPNGLSCRKCNKVFYWRSKLREHHKRHNMDENAAVMELIQTTNETTKHQTASAATVATVLTTTIPTATSILTETLLQNGINIVNSAMTNVTTPTTSITTSTTAYTMPPDAIPQVVETDNNIENDIEFDFNGDALFEDFDEDDDDEIECDDILQDAVLTSDEDFEELLEDQNGSNITLRPYCIHCCKYYYSQYHFENHMFVHRGLAPYRCEMCTNLYNTKRALIRHYSAVHKKIPTRDMIQAKGDKVSVNITPTEYTQLEPQKDFTLMCAKCPYESKELRNLQIHLDTNHNITDENYILQKLPFECPRCIRSFANKACLIRHLERSHSNASIMQVQEIEQHAILTQSKTATSIEKLTPTAAGTTLTTTTPTTISTNSSDRCETNQIILGIVLNDSTLGTTVPAPSTSITTTTPSITTNSSAQQQLLQEPPSYTTIDINDIIAADTKLPIVPLDIVIPSATKTAIATTTIATNTTTTTAAAAEVENPSCTSLDSMHSPTTTAALTENVNFGYRCVACEYTCDRMEELSEHSKVHPSDDSRENFNFQCAICDCKYKTIELLKYHLKRHIARNYACSECPKTFINRSELKNHKLMHTGEMPHKCDMCDKQFRYSHHLKRHKDVAHFGKRHQCPFIGCGRTFTTQAQLKIHAWNHNGNVPYKCNNCNREFKKRELLRQHARKVHNVTLTEEQIAEIYRNTVGYTNPHDFTVKISNGQMLRRSDVETICAMPHLLQDDAEFNDVVDNNEIYYELEVMNNQQ